VAAAIQPRATTLRAVLLGTLVAACADASSIPIRDLLGAAGLRQPSVLDDGTITAGLKEALRVGTDRAVQSTSREDGFLGNDLIRIALPEQLERTADGLRTVGFGRQVDELEVAMNRAAERAAGEAAAVFLDAIRQMTFADARSIWQGPDDAATAYFRSRTSAALGARFRPIVDESMQKVGLARLYDELLATLARLPLVPRPDLDLRKYVTDRTLAGIFTVLEQEEARIRTDPAARTTQLLRTVFGSA
jgi:hypothetical protein